MNRHHWEKLAYVAVIVAITLLPVWLMVLLISDVTHPASAFLLVGALTFLACTPYFIIHRLNLAWWRKGLTSIAGKYGLAFSGADPDNLPQKYGVKRFIPLRGRVVAGPVIRGKFGDGEILYFDYRIANRVLFVTTGVVAYHVPCSFKELLVRPETSDDKLKAAMGSPDINLDLAEFNDRFFVECEDKKFAYAVLHQRAMQFFLDGKPPLTMHMKGEVLLFFWTWPVPASALDPDNVERLMLDVRAFFELIPPYLRSEYAQEGSRRE